MVKIFQILGTCMLIIGIVSCDAGLFSGSSSGGPEISVQAQSSALNTSTQAIAQSTSRDWIRDGERITARVEGVRGVFTGIALRGDTSGDPERFDGDALAEWILCSDETLEFDLSSLSELITVQDAVPPGEGLLNIVGLEAEYVEMDISFKGELTTIRIPWVHDPETEEKAGDILVKADDGTFKWVNVTNQSLSTVRPESAMHLNTFGVHEGTDDLGSLVLDNVSNEAYMADPPPWTDHETMVAEHGEDGRLEPYYTVDEETGEKNLTIVLNLCFENAATFVQYKNIGDPGDDSTDSWDESTKYFQLVETGSGTELRDLEDNPVDTAEFTILDILPALTYPAVTVHAEIEESARG